MVLSELSSEQNSSKTNISNKIVKKGNCISPNKI